MVSPTTSVATVLHTATLRLVHVRVGPRVTVAGLGIIASLLAWRVQQYVERLL